MNEKNMIGQWFHLVSDEFALNFEFQQRYWGVIYDCDRLILREYIDDIPYIQEVKMINACELQSFYIYFENNAIGIGNQQKNIFHYTLS